MLLIMHNIYSIHNPEIVLDFLSLFPNNSAPLHRTNFEENVYNNKTKGHKVYA